MIKKIIFDLGGVVIKHQTHFLEQLLSEMFSISVEEATKLWDEKRGDLLIGKISSGEFLEKLRVEKNCEKSTKELLQIWKERYIQAAQEVDWELLGFVEELKSEYDVYLMTDTLDTHDEYNIGRGIYDKFTGVFRSNIEGVSKLTDEGFENLLSKINAQPEECVLIDDLPENVTQAKSLGLEAILYRNLNELKVELRDLEIKIPD